MKGIKEFFIVLDWYVARGLQWLTQAVITVSLFVLGLIVAFFSIKVIFEYNDGLADMSSVEYLYLLLLGLLSFRYYAQIQVSELNTWQRISTPLLFVGKLSLITLILYLGAALEAKLTETQFMLSNVLQDNASQLLLQMVVLFSLYIATPKLLAVSTPVDVSKERQADAEQSVATVHPNGDIDLNSDCEEPTVQTGA